MDYEIYYDQKADGTYLLHFPNHKGLSQSELEDIFSKFGEVIIDQRGQTHGLCFIKYQQLSDAKRCIDGMQNHGFIKILPHKNKVGSTSNKKNDQNRNNQHSPAPQKNQYQKNTNNTKNKRHSHQMGDKKSDCDIPKLLASKDESSFNEDATENDNGSDISSVTSRKSLNQFLKLKMLKKAASSTSVSSGTVDESMKGVEETLNESEIPPLICNQKFTRSNGKFSTVSKIILAQDVVVANIHPSLGIHYILHLFEKHNPLGVSHMMTTSKTGIRYCYVYFETSAEAKAIEKKFDAHILHGSSLIVLRSHKLKEEAFSL